MSLSDILSSALSGLGAAQSGMRTVSNNIANVNTPGYAREQANQETGVSGGRVSGVVVGEPSRIADRFLEATVYTRAGDAGRAAAASTYLDRLQALLGAPGAESSLPARLDAISSAATAMSGAAGATQTSAAFVGQVGDAFDSLGRLGSDITALRGDVEGEVGDTVDRINTLLSSVHELNDSVARLQGLGRSTAGVADRRTSALQELSGLIGITAREQADGRVNVDTASGVPLLDRRLRQISYPASGAGVAQPQYPAMEIRFADGGATTGGRIDSSAIGGTLGGLLSLRDGTLPAFAEQVGTLATGLAQTLNAASNAGTSVPAPATLTGRATLLGGTDRLGFTGTARVAVVRSDGTLDARIDLDFAGLSTVDAMVAKINTDLAGYATATFDKGVLTLAAVGSGKGIVVAQPATAASARAGVGFSQYFGLNDLVRSDTSTLVPSGLAGGDPHGFASGQTADLALRDAGGRTLARYSLTGSVGSDIDDLVTELNTSALGGYGAFSLDDGGRIRFAATTANAGSSIAILADTTTRAGTDRGFSDMAGFATDPQVLADVEVRRDIAADPTRLPLARLQDVAVGAKALGAADRRGATGFIDALAATVDLGKDGVTTIARLATDVLGKAGSVASSAQAKATDLGARRDDAIQRRDNFSGVSIDEELAQMVVLQNSYSAAARVMTSANAMFDTLLGMVN